MALQAHAEILINFFEFCTIFNTREKVKNMFVKDVQPLYVFVITTTYINNKV